MSTTVNPTSATPSVPASLTGPADGDACNAASQNGPDQALLDAVTALRIASYGAGHRPSMYSYNLTDVLVSATASIMVTEGGSWTARSAVAGAIFTVANLEGGGSFTVSTWYYLYYYLSAGTVTKEISSTGPDATRRYKSGTTTHAYLGAIRVDSGGNIVPFNAQRGSYKFTDGVAVPGSSLSGAGPTDVALGVALPPSARMALLRIYGNSTNDATPVTLNVYPKGAPTTTGDFVVLAGKVTDATGLAAATNPGTSRIWCGTDGSQNVTFAATATHYTATLSVLGFDEE